MSPLASPAEPANPLPLTLIDRFDKAFSVLLSAGAAISYGTIIMANQDGKIDPTIARLQKVFRGVFDNDDLIITRQTTAADVDDWDSINHVNLVLAVEREFNVRLSSSGIASLKNVGELADLLESSAKRA
jgi:acyl carrier protein